MCYIPNDSHEEYIEKRYRELVLYFEGLDRVGIPYGISELTKKSKELGLPIPSIENGKIIWNKQ